MRLAAAHEAGGSDGAAPVTLDPCIGLGPGSRLHVQGAPHLSASTEGGELARAVSSLLRDALGSGFDMRRSEQVLNSTLGRMAWTSGWDLASAALPNPISLAGATADRDGAGEGGGRENGWLHSPDAFLVPLLTADGDGSEQGRLQWSQAMRSQVLVPPFLGLDPSPPTKSQSPHRSVPGRPATRRGTRKMTAARTADALRSRAPVYTCLPQSARTGGPGNLAGSTRNIVSTCEQGPRRTCVP